MPLKFPRQIRKSDAAAQRVRFFGQDGERTVLCGISWDALCADGAQADLLERFDRNRCLIERVASRNYDARGKRLNGPVLLETIALAGNARRAIG